MTYESDLILLAMQKIIFYAQGAYFHYFNEQILSGNEINAY